jgi:hypothetical protein
MIGVGPGYKSVYTSPLLQERTDHTGVVKMRLKLYCSSVAASCVQASMPGSRGYVFENESTTRVSLRCCCCIDIQAESVSALHNSSLAL